MAKNDNLTDFLTDVANAIRYKKNITNKINPQDFRDEILSIEYHPSDEPESTTNIGSVVFYDYDGTVLYSYSKDAFLVLNSMPAAPPHQGLVFQEWNWSIDDAKNYVIKYGKLDIGAIYGTDDGKTRVYIEITSIHNNKIDITFRDLSATPALVEWGDGTETIAHNDAYKSTVVTHTFDLGSYCICISPVTQGKRITLSNVDNTIYQSGGSIYRNCAAIKKLEIGENIALSSFTGWGGIQTVTIPTTMTVWGNEVFNESNLSHVNLPIGSTIGEHSFNSIKTVSLPSKCTIQYGAFMGSGIERVCIPSECVLANAVFYGCESLKEVVLPSELTAIKGSMFYNADIEEITIYDTVELLGQDAFRNTSLKNIILPANTDISRGTFAYTPIEQCKLSSKVTSLYETFIGCRYLLFLDIPNSVTEIKSLFKNCTSLQYVSFLSHDNAPAITNLFSEQQPLTTKVLVPEDKFDLWVNNEFSAYKTYLTTNIDPDEVISLTIDADDVAATNTTTYIYINALVNGKRVTDGEHVENAVYRRCVKSSSFTANTSSDARTIDIEYTLLGVTVTTTITQAGVETADE